MTLKYLAFLIPIFLMTSCAFYHDADFSQKAPLSHRGAVGLPDATMPQEPGKCYAKCKISESGGKVISVVKTYSAEESIEESIMESREVSPAGTKWVKKKADKNCMSANPDDCLVWCLQETKAIYDTRWVEIDSSGEEALQIVYSEYETPNQEGRTEWREVVCQGDLTPSLISEIRVALLDRGYEAGIGQKADDIFKKSLLKFQADNNLPYGQLDVDTLSALGVYY